MAPCLIRHAIALRHPDREVSAMAQMLATLGPFVATTASIFARLTPGLSPTELVLMEAGADQGRLTFEAAVLLAGASPVNPFAPRRFAASSGAVGVADLGALPGAVRSAYRDRCLRPNGLRHQACVYLRDGDRLIAALTLLRGDDHPEFATAELAFLAQARPLMESALRVATSDAAGPGPGMASLTEREREVASLAVDGLDNASIAATLQIKLSTVKTYLTRVYVKVGVRSRTELIAALAPHHRGADLGASLASRSHP